MKSIPCSHTISYNDLDGSYKEKIFSRDRCPFCGGSEYTDPDDAVMNIPLVSEQDRNKYITGNLKPKGEKNEQSYVESLVEKDNGQR